MNLLGVGLPQAAAAAPDTNSAASLRARYAELGQQLSNNQFKRPLYLDSVESSSQLRGDIYALVDYPFAAVNAAFNNPAHWCDMLILHINTKYCRASTNTANNMLAVSIGKKDYPPLDHAYRVEFAYSVATMTAEQFEKRLQNWFTATELYPRQLHEVDRAAYLDMKRRELVRQRTAP